MAALDDFLLRFRRVLAPPGLVGGQLGAPVDLAASLDDELRDVTTALAAIAHEAEAIVRKAESEADSITSDARLEATSLVEAARVRAPRVRAEYAAARIRDRHAEIADLIAGAEKAAADITEQARARMRPLVERLVEDVLAAAPAEGRHARVVGRG